MVVALFKAEMEISTRENCERIAHGIVIIVSKALVPPSPALHRSCMYLLFSHRGGSKVRNKGKKVE